MGLSPRSALRALLLVVATAAGGWAEAQQPENIPQDNSDAVARKLFTQLMQKQTGQAPAPDTLWAYEVDFNLDGFSEIYGYVYQPDCDGTKCGLFLFALERDGYREVLGEVPGARLTDPNKVSLSAFKRNGFMEVRLDQTLAAWKDGRYLDVSRLPGTTLDGAAYLDACSRANPDDQQPLPGSDKSACECRFERLQAIGFTQQQLDLYTKSVSDNGADPEETPLWNETRSEAEDAQTGCDVEAGKTNWTPGYVQHGEQQQSSRLDFDRLIDACAGSDWVNGDRKVGTPDRALGFCGCLARELPTWGVDQDGVDLLARYYANQASENDLDQQQPDLLDRNDSATEACVGTMPAR